VRVACPRCAYARADWLDDCFGFPDHSHHRLIQPSENVTYSLDNLLEGITSANTHGEFSFGKPLGKEAL